MPRMWHRRVIFIVLCKTYLQVNAESIFIYSDMNVRFMFRSFLRYYLLDACISATVSCTVDKEFCILEKLDCRLENAPSTLDKVIS